MVTLQLGFKAFDPHELLCHFVADRAGLYKREGLAIELLDITFIAAPDLPESLFQVSCGAALLSAVQGLPRRIIFVATDRPLFWIYAGGEIRRLAQLKHQKLATFPATAPPHHLADIILQKSGITMEKDIKLLPARDDAARFGLLKTADVEAAVISSAMAPAKIAAAGFNQLCFFGDALRLPTTGLAVHPSRLEQEAQLLHTLVGLMQESLRIIHNDAAITAAVLGEVFAVEAAFRQETAELYQQYFTADGRTTAEIAQTAIASICRSLAVTAVPERDQVYYFPDGWE